MHGFIAALAKAGKYILKIAGAAFGALKGLSYKEIASLLSFVTSAGITIAEFVKYLKKTIRNAKTRDNKHHVVSTMTGVDSEEKSAIRNAIIDEADKEAQINVSGADKDYSTKKGKHSIKTMKERLKKREKWMIRNNKRVVPKNNDVEIDKSSNKDFFKGISMMDPNFAKCAVDAINHAAA